VAGETELTNDYIVDGAGNISMPYIQSVHVAGLSAPETERLLASLPGGLSAQSEH
jgi:protein involved in polysaccharide export with SLBB domain